MNVSITDIIETCSPSHTRKKIIGKATPNDIKRAMKESRKSRMMILTILRGAESCLDGNLSAREKREQERDARASKLVERLSGPLRAQASQDLLKEI